MHITLKQLTIFTMVAEHNSFTLAAKVLNMTQPAISAQIAKLESQLGVKLVEVVGKRLVLTPAGHSILTKALDVGREVSDLKRVANELTGLVSGELHISVNPAFQKVIFPILAEFHRMYPAIELTIKITDRISQLNLLRDNIVDFCIMGIPPSKSSLHYELLTAYNSVCLAPIDHPLVDQKNIPLADISHETFIIGEHYTQSRRILENEIMTNDSTLIHVNNAYALQYAVESGLGVAIVADKILEPEFIGKKYKILDLESFPRLSELYIVYRHQKLLTPAAEKFKRLAQTYCQEHFHVS